MTTCPVSIQEVKVSSENIGQLLFLNDGDLSHFILALHTPEDESQVVAMFLQGKWWPVGDVLKTSNKSRCGLLLVESLMERVVLFLLSQVIFGILERPLEDDLYFSAYSLREHGKILWQDGEAVGFYTVKKKGSLCNGSTGQSYRLPVLDTVFVRPRWRRTGLALQMLEDFCSSQPFECILGISFPMSPSMYGGGNSEQGPHCSSSHERSHADLKEEDIPQHYGSSVKNTPSSGKKRPADKTNTGANFKKART